MVIKVINTDPIVIERLIQALPEFTLKTTKAEISHRCKGKDAKYIGCKAGGDYAGFLVSYAISSEIYYNWIMGVLPDYRKNHCASLMMDQFENYAGHKNYKICRVKTMNKYRHMLHMLISRGYNIVGILDEKILFEKEI